MSPDVNPIILALKLVLLHGPGGQVVEINPEQVVEIREPRGTSEAHFHKEVKCLIFTTDGKFASVTEDCETVGHALAGTSK